MDLQQCERPSELHSRGRKRPDLDMRAASPRALSDAVLPPVLGPVTVITRTPAATVKSTALGGGSRSYQSTRDISHHKLGLS